MSQEPRPAGGPSQELHALEVELLHEIASPNLQHWTEQVPTRVSESRERDGRWPEVSNYPDGAWETAVRSAHERVTSDLGLNPAQVLADELFGGGLPVGLNPKRFLRNLEELREAQRLRATASGDADSPPTDEPDARRG